MSAGLEDMAGPNRGWRDGEIVYIRRTPEPAEEHAEPDELLGAWLMGYIHGAGLIVGVFDDGTRLFKRWADDASEVLAHEIARIYGHAKPSQALGCLLIGVIEAGNLAPVYENDDCRFVVVWPAGAAAQIGQTVIEFASQLPVADVPGKFGPEFSWDPPYPHGVVHNSAKPKGRA